MDIYSTKCKGTFFIGISLTCLIHKIHDFFRLIQLNSLEFEIIANKTNQLC